MGRDSHIGFTKVDEDGYLENRVGVQVAQLNVVKMHRTAEEIANMKSKAAWKERLEYDDLMGLRGGKILTFHKPLAEFRLQKNSSLH